LENSPEKSGPNPKRIEGHYTQVNILFPSSQVELPSADKFNAFPPEAQAAILAAFEREQTERHAWLKQQQHNDHDLNKQSSRNYFYWRITGTISGTLIVLTALGGGIWLVKNGASAIGVFLLIAAIGGIIGTAIYGHRTVAKPTGQNPSQNAADAQ